MGLPSYFEDIDELAAELASNLSGEEVRYLLAKVGWQPNHTKIVAAARDHASLASGQPRSAAEGAILLRQFLKSVLAKLKQDHERAKNLQRHVDSLKAEVERLRVSRDREAERSRRLQSKLKDLSTVRTHRG